MRQTTDQMWLHLTRGDTARTAIVRGRLDSASSLLTFVAIPVIAGASDAFGRKLVVSLGAWALLLVNSLVLFAPSGPAAVFLLGAREILLPISMNMVDIPRLASLGDMYSADAVALSEATAFNSAIFPMCKIVGPLIGGVLASRGGLRAPFVASTVCMAAQALLALQLHETLPAPKRKPLRWRHTSPFAFLALFRCGGTMAKLAAMAMLSSFSETGGQPTAPEQVANLHKARLLGWGVPERSRYESLNSIVRVSGLRCLGPVIRRLGLRGAMQTGLLVYLLQTMFLSQARSSWQFFCVLPSFVLNILRSQALQTAIVQQEAAVSAGFGQAELRGMMQNLTTVRTLHPPPHSGSSESPGAPEPKLFST